MQGEHDARPRTHARRRDRPGAGHARRRRRRPRRAGAGVRPRGGRACRDDGVAGGRRAGGAGRRACARRAGDTSAGESPRCSPSRRCPVSRSARWPTSTRADHSSRGSSRLLILGVAGVTWRRSTSGRAQRGGGPRVAVPSDPDVEAGRRRGRARGPHRVLRGGRRLRDRADAERRVRRADAAGNRHVADRDLPDERCRLRESPGAGLAASTGRWCFRSRWRRSPAPLPVRRSRPAFPGSCSAACSRCS